MISTAESSVKSISFWAKRLGAVPMLIVINKIIVIRKNNLLVIMLPPLFVQTIAFFKIGMTVPPVLQTSWTGHIPE